MVVVAAGRVVDVVEPTAAFVVVVVAAAGGAPAASGAATAVAGLEDVAWGPALPGPPARAKPSRAAIICGPSSSMPSAQIPTPRTPYWAASCATSPEAVQLSKYDSCHWLPTR